MSDMVQEKPHISVVICGHANSGKSTTAGRLLFELGGIEACEKEKLKTKAKEFGRDSSAFAFFMDRHKDERSLGCTISYTIKEFFTSNYHYSIIDVPGRKNFIQNMISGASHADIALILVPADDTFTSAIAKSNRRLGEVRGGTREHTLLLGLLGIRQFIVGINKMDTEPASYTEERFIEIRDAVRLMLRQCARGKHFVLNTPILPLSGFKGDNILKPSSNMTWWKGCSVELGNFRDCQVVTLLDALDKFSRIPFCENDVPLRVPIGAVYKIKGVGDVVVGCVQQGSVAVNSEVVFMPTHTPSDHCEAKVFSIERYHKRINKASTGDIVGFNIKGLKKNRKPRVGDVMILKSDQTLVPCKSFIAQLQTFDIPSVLKVGDSLIGFVHCCRSVCKIIKINWKSGKKTKLVVNAHSLQSDEIAEVVFEPQQALAIDSQSTKLARFAFFKDNSAVLLARIVSEPFNVAILQEDD